MNLKIRMKNWSFWFSIFISIFTPILAYFGITGQDITTWGKLGEILLNAISNPYVVLMVVISVYNAIVDPTTSGIKDSDRVMSYTKPGGSDE